MYVIHLDYIAPLHAIDAALGAHREWLDRQYAAGLFLASGPREPRAGGVIIAATRPREALRAAIDDDPFAVRNLARHRLIEFAPSRIAPPEAWAAA